MRIKKLSPNAIIPQYATVGSACFDLCACIDPMDTPFYNVYPQSSMIVRTGLAFEIPEGYVMLVFSRSGHGFNHGVRLANCVGVIDSDYRGEVLVKLVNDSDEDGLPFKFKHGDRIAQAMLLPVNQVIFEEVVELSETDRGQGGFGSTDHKQLDIFNYGGTE